MDGDVSMLTVKQAALRASVSESLIYAWCVDGTLSHFRVGRKGKRGGIRILIEDLDAALAAFKVTPPSPSASTASDRPASPFAELNTERLSRAWKQS
jgi:excisionase family DNA binding protein